MKKSGYKSVLAIYSALFILSALVILTGTGLVIGIVTVEEPAGGTVKSNWPQEYTSNFSEYFDISGDVPIITQTGMQSLDDYRLWIQIFDKNGDEVFAHNTTGVQPTHYSPIDFLRLYQGERNPGESVFAESVTTDAGQWTYIIGFPMSIRKVTMLLDAESFTGGKSMIVRF